MSPSLCARNAGAVGGACVRVSDSSEGCHIVMSAMSPVRTKNGTQVGSWPAESVANGLQNPFGKLQWPLHLRVQRRAIRLASGAPLEVGTGSLAQRVIRQEVNAG